jgi:para-aminobenzoate synthetase / 4-amino-4-deoxychorismate lyase
LNRPPLALFESFDRRRDTASFLFAEMTEEIVARSTAEVLPALRRIEEGVARGLHAAGFVSYEAASAINPDLTTRPAGDCHLLHFVLFRRRRAIPPGHFRMATVTGYRADRWRSSVSQATHAAAVTRIREYIAAGDTYQVNFTFRQSFCFRNDPFTFYRDLCGSQRAPFCAYLDLGERQILSASPELFFRLDGRLLTVRPMKGTALRGRWFEEDEERKILLREDPKERAENLMIVDLLRNDLGMVSETGSVAVVSLFDIETLETVHQMTSTITSRLKEGVGLAGIFQSLFPCGSVTGAPKRRTMEIITALEDSPRNLYTGCVGFISPGPEAVFSVAIRTAVIDPVRGKGELGVGSGVTFDSCPEAEYAECRAKARFARERRPDFQLVETILFAEESGFFLLERHLERLMRSAAYFAFHFHSGPLREALVRHAAQLSGRNKVRLLLSRQGTFTIESEPVADSPPDRTLIVAWAKARVDSRDPFLYHKTTHRPVYAAEPAQRPECVDLLFRNERDEATEGANHNIVARLGGRLFTPSLSCGVLPGVFRAELLEMGEIGEKVITRLELERAEEIWLINSVRQWRRVRLA